MSQLDREEPSHFGAGPAQMPTNVLKQAALDLLNYQNMGLGIGEISHRSKEAVALINETKENLIKLLEIPGTHDVFFLQGGGTTGFSSIATNLNQAYIARHGKVGKAGYLVTGSWSQKAYEEAKRLRIQSEVIFDARNFSQDGKFGIIPNEKEWSNKIESLKDDLSYVYLCENETVHGIEWGPELPKCLSDVEVVADLSSDILSRKIDVSRYGVIMAGAQKNIGLAGLTLYIIKKSLLSDIEKFNKEFAGKFEDNVHVPVTPIAFEFPTAVKNNSSYNTIPIFTLHVMNLVFRNLIAKGGIEQQQIENEEKAELLYRTLDSFPEFYNIPVDKSCRSKMNVVFTIKKDGLDDLFIEGAKKLKLTGLKGHRSVGGFRASIYNALSLEAVTKLADFVEDFAKKNM
ncbi:hypothetical protein KAFR_0G02400 [Kazachstania africana CBS 2517]|uniref:Phosphoserine aminotransferase n=1 Tax=Kazachstania africana (strain ATCC 22294 / BCRC 22015 / CBS 2517 / CECT 1963 / NBRC 1671 / NRRL Y-8276) TaxID=1071382 RepID=H2AY24_KAZAF|nr:hypothetical protein KAFR_0G02400 [Kazachstania africana CBS 2517]CCF59274.1 hypothetical protein KAFR_0G02400 [Kazachstania africana CBS 2517]